MNQVRDQLVEFIRLKYAEQSVNSYTAVEELDERFGDAVIPGLIECLKDGHPEIRHMAVQLLSAARPRSNVAVPDLIERMNDEDWLVVTTVMLHLGDFGQLAAAAIPMIEPWLESPNQYLRVMAAISIVRIDPSRTEFLPDIRGAVFNDNPAIAGLAQDFFEGGHDS